MAAKIVNPKLTVIAEGGDGDGYGEGEIILLMQCCAMYTLSTGA
jgi:pyruvate/2-oxoacid:ferredoxin oxidoreductase beta subunit